jgi:hypothetical protein
LDGPTPVDGDSSFFFSLLAQAGEDFVFSFPGEKFVFELALGHNFYSKAHPLSIWKFDFGIPSFVISVGYFKIRILLFPSR